MSNGRRQAGQHGGASIRHLWNGLQVITSYKGQRCQITIPDVTPTDELNNCYAWLDTQNKNQAHKISSEPREFVLQLSEQEFRNGQGLNPSSPMTLWANSKAATSSSC